jgi:hypothetical protein
MRFLPNVMAVKKPRGNQALELGFAINADARRMIGASN